MRSGCEVHVESGSQHEDTRPNRDTLSTVLQKSISGRKTLQGERLNRRVIVEKATMRERTPA